jgi:uncharacterized membrane protein
MAANVARTEPAENYVPTALHRKFRRQAVKAWGIGLAVVISWLLLIVAVPLFKGYGMDGISTPIYSFFSYICHQIPERSLRLAGHQMGVCSRCFGVYFGLFAGFFVYPLWRAVDEIDPLPRFWLFLSLIPIGIDWSLTVFGIWENTHLSRFVTGAILGFGCATYIVPAIVEMTRNLTMRRAG